MRGLIFWATAAALGLGTAPAAAQITTIDPNTQIDSDLDSPPPPAEDSQDVPPVDPGAYPGESSTQMPDPGAPYPEQPAQPYPAQPAQPTQQPGYQSPVQGDATNARERAVDTFNRDELVGAAEGVFGKGASGLAGIIEDILKDQGQPNAYIAGSEAAGAVGVGLRYGLGSMVHKIEGERKVYWTGPSIGFDLGGDANKVFVLVYNLYDSQELYKRFPAGEGRVYFVGGFSASYMRRGDVVLIPVRLGVGWRVGVNAGYMKFTEKRRILPF